jgi:CheY-like chemotaxis protein
VALIVAAFRTAEGRRTIQTMLERAGHTVTLCRTGAAAAAEARTSRPDLLIADSRLADLDPHQICAVLESHPSTAALPVVVCGPVDTELQRRFEDGSGRVIRALLVPSSIRSAVSAALDAGARTATCSPASRRPTTRLRTRTSRRCCTVRAGSAPVRWWLRAYG